VFTGFFTTEEAADKSRRKNTACKKQANACKEQANA